MHSNSIHHDKMKPAGAANPPDQDFLDEVFERAVRLVEDGLIPETDALLAGHEALRTEVERLVHLARHVAVGAAAPLPTLAGFTLLQQLGQGGMGTVYLARQHSLGGRPVALKVLPSGAALSPRSRARFLAEASAIARLRHPNIVAVHDVVHQDDVYAYAMEWIDGSSLAEVIDKKATESRSHGGTKGKTRHEHPALGDDVAKGHSGREDGPFSDSDPSWLRGSVASCLSVPDICRIGLAIARALEAVHAAGLLHRDVKPSNILLRRDGTPLLADFGLARELDSSVRTQAGHFAGTVAYAPPEQLRGDPPPSWGVRTSGQPETDSIPHDGRGRPHSPASCVDARSDIYALGVTLYHALALRLPFEARNPATTLRRIESGAATPLRKVNPRVPRDLETIVAKAMEADPARRYQCAGDLAADLERFMNFQPIHARPAGLLTRGVKLVRRNRGAALGLALGSVITLALAVVAVTYVFFLPGWVAEHVREARLTLLSPDHANNTVSMLFWGRINRYGSDALKNRRTELQGALNHYDAAIRLAPFDDALQRERSVVAAAAEGSEGTWDDPRSTGLFAYLTQDYERALRDWARYEQTRDPLAQADPLVDAALGVLYLFDDQAARAYPRLQHAVEAFPGVRFLMEYLADAAVKCGDVDRAEQWLNKSKPISRAGSIGARDRVEAALVAARGRSDEAIAAYRRMQGTGVTRVELARLLDREGRVDEALEAWMWAAGQFPRSSRVQEGLVTCADRWWSTLPKPRRLHRIRSTLDGSPESILTLLRRYQASNIREEPDSRAIAGAKRGLNVAGFQIFDFKFQILTALYAALSSPPLESLSLNELAERMEVENMSLWSPIPAFPRAMKELHFASTRWSTLRPLAFLAGTLLSRVKVWSRAGSIVVAATIMPGTFALGQTFTTEPYASVTDPTLLSFGASGNLLCGRDALGSGGGSGDPTKIHRVGPGGAPVEELGISPIDDPDSILFDALGVLSPVPGSVLVGGLIFNTPIGQISAIRPDNSVVILYSSNVWQNVGEMKFDHTGRLLFPSISYTGEPHGIFASTGGAPTRIATVSGAPVYLAVAANNELFVSCTDGVIRRYAADGTLINNNFAAGYGSIEFGPGGAFGTDLYMLTFSTGVLSRIDMSGVATPVLTGLPTDDHCDLAFGPDGLLYLSDFANDRIIRIVPVPPCTTPPCFQGLGDLPGGVVSSRAESVSSDGTTVVGASISSASNPEEEATRWRADTGLVGLGDLPGAEFSSYAVGVSANGNEVTGSSRTTLSTGGPQPRLNFLWTQATGIQALPDFPGGAEYSTEGGMSDSGVIVGAGDAGNAYLPLRWVAGAPSLISNDFTNPSGSNAISRNGQWITGTGLSNYYRWSAQTGIEYFGPQVWYPYSVSDTGVVVGYHPGSIAWKWTPQSGLISLPDLAGGSSVAAAFGISANGTLILGSGNSPNGLEAVMWMDSGASVQRVADVVTAAGVAVPVGWTLTEARDMTINGNIATICGNGTNPQGNPEAWIARYTLPPVCESPQVSQHPQNATIAAGANAIFTISATGTAPLSYQWRKNTVSLNNGASGCSSTIGGATIAVLTISNVSTTDNATYDCVVTNACGSDTSDPATLTVPPGPACAGDMDGNNMVDGNDIDEFVTKLLAGGACS